MTMISGPYTDAIVNMLMGEERRLFDGDILKNPQGQYGVFTRQGVWIADPVVHLIDPSEFDAAHSKKLIFPEPFAGGFRFVHDDGDIWIPTFTTEEIDLLKSCGYQPVSAEKTLIRIGESCGERHFSGYPLSCKTDIWQEEDLRKVAFCFERFCN